MSFDQEPDQQADKEDWYMAENRHLRHALFLVMSYALTAKSDSQEWLQGMADRLNAAAVTLKDDDRAIVGEGYLILKKAAPIGWINGRDIVL